MPSDRLRAELRAFIKLDKNSQPVPSVLVYRKSMPKVGRWKEVLADFCCDNSTAQAFLPLPLLGTFPYDVLAGCGGANLSAQLTLTGATQADLLADLLAQLTSTYVAKGTFAVSADGKYIIFTPISPCPPTNGGAVFSIGAGTF